MKFREGDRIVITTVCSIMGWTGTVYKITDGDHIHCKWDGHDSGWMFAKDLELISNFRIGDTVRIGKSIIEIDGNKRFDESGAVLISRKNLI